MTTIESFRSLRDDVAATASGPAPDAQSPAFGHWLACAILAPVMLHPWRALFLVLTVGAVGYVVEPILKPMN